MHSPMQIPTNLAQNGKRANGLQVTLALYASIIDARIPVPTKKPG
ncbi:hypothetical protein HYPP_02145 [Hyphomicrobium sp. ghe19]|nr:hypothetical protein HYPP_02145 [Hyphomicrobium sp. ghe19]